MRWQGQRCNVIKKHGNGLFKKKTIVVVDYITIDLPFLMIIFVIDNRIIMNCAYPELRERCQALSWKFSDEIVQQT